jgi:hypothetical protein
MQVVLAISLASAPSLFKRAEERCCASQTSTFGVGISLAQQRIAGPVLYPPAVVVPRHCLLRVIADGQSDVLLFQADTLRR